MLASVKNYDLICYQLRNSFYSQLDNPMKRDVDKLSNDITNILKNGKKIQDLPLEILAQIFSLRIKAIKWFSTDNNFDFLEMVSSVSEQIESIGENKRMGILKENIQFALRINMRFIESLYSEGEQLGNIKMDFNNFPDINYQQYLAFLAFTIPDDESVQKFSDWTNTSLYIEFVMLAADISRVEKIYLSDKAINELSYMVANAAQEFSALATEFGFFKSRLNQQTVSNPILNKAFLNQEKKLADLGIEDFALNFTSKS